MSTIYPPALMYLHCFCSYSFNTATRTFVRGMSFNNDGTKMFVSGTMGNDVNEYSLSTAFDISTATFIQNFSFVYKLQVQWILHLIMMERRCLCLIFYRCCV